jgi:hypothetical protein
MTSGVVRAKLTVSPFFLFPGVLMPPIPGLLSLALADRRISCAPGHRWAAATSIRGFAAARKAAAWACAFSVEGRRKSFTSSSWLACGTEPFWGLGSLSLKILACQRFLKRALWELSWASTMAWAAGRIAAPRSR